MQTATGEGLNHGGKPPKSTKTSGAIWQAHFGAAFQHLNARLQPAKAAQDIVQECKNMEARSLTNSNASNARNSGVHVR